MIMTKYQRLRTNDQKPMTISILPLDPNQEKEISTDLGFGGSFSNRMFQQSYSEERGWHDAMIKPYGPFSLDPASAVLHYGQEIFEGTKAYLTPEGKINLFRPMKNMERFNISAERMAMPKVDVDFHLEAIKSLVSLESEWVPSQPGTALYIRPFMFASRATLGVHASDKYIHAVIVGPVGSYFKNGFNTVGVLISDKYRRACKGGTGFAKTGGNYAASLMVGAQATKQGYQQVLWLDSKEGKYMEEVGAMNMWIVYEGKKLVTPPLSDSILQGVTRDSVITLARDLGYEVDERPLHIDEVVADIESGKVTEAFGCGTAAVISPVGRLGYKEKDYVMNNNEVGEVATRLYDQLTGIQTGRLEDPYGWTTTIEAAQAEPAL